MQFFSFMGRNIYVSPVTKFLLYLKITAFFIVFASLQIHAKGVAQTVRLDMSNGSVTALIKDIQRQTGYAFLYNLNDIKELDAISISIESDNIREVLAESLKDLPLDFLVKEDEKVVILKRSTKKINRERLLASLRQQSTVQGIVVDTSGTPLTGVTVSVKNRASMATSTDVNGRYVLQVPEDAVLVFTMVGYHTHEVIVGNQREIDVVLEMSASLLDDVVVVGFGTQKRTNLVASVTSVSPGNLKVPSSNLTTALAGQAAGIIAYQRSGEPGQDNADFFVRGITTFGTNTNPLILIDGIELTSNDLARLRPDDIQSFSILKDATATALYGSRGANGVILVVTKQGKEGPAKFSFRVENSISAPTQTVDVADPVTYMKMHNEAILTRDPLGTILYSQEKIEMTEAGRYPLIYPANDWKSMLFKNYTMNQRSNLNVSGGGGVARYYVAGSFNRDNGILNVDKRNNFNNNIAINNYDLRSTVNIDLTKWTELIVRLSANFEEYKGPLRGGADMYNLMVHSNPVLFPAYYPADEDFQYAQHILFGNFNNSKINPYAEMVRGYKEKSRSQILAQLELKQDLEFITKGLTGRGMLNISRLSQFAVNRSYNPFYYELSRYNRLTGDYNLVETDIGTEYLGYGELPNDREQYSSFYFEEA